MNTAQNFAKTMRRLMHVRFRRGCTRCHEIKEEACFYGADRICSDCRRIERVKP